MITAARSRSLVDGLTRGAEAIAAGGESRGIAALLFSPIKDEVEFIFRRGLSLELCGALSDKAGSDLLSWARRTPRSHLLRTEGLVGRAPALHEPLTREGLGGLALFPLLGEESVIGYMVLGLQKDWESVPWVERSATAAWEEFSRNLEALREEAGKAVLRALLDLHKEGLARGVEALLVLDQEDRILFSHGVSRIFPGWGRGEVMGQQLKALPGGRVLAATEATGSGHLSWRTRKVTAGGRNSSLALAAHPISPEWEGRGHWRAILVRGVGGPEEEADGGILLELALRLAPGEGRSKSEEDENKAMALVRGALAAAEQVQGEDAIDFSGVFRGFLHRLEPELRDDRIQILPFLHGDLPRVRGDRRLLETALWALLRKAWVSLLPRGGTITLRTWEEEGSVWCSIADDGEGLEDWSMLESLSLEPLLSSMSQEVLPPSGLELAQRLIRAGGGTFHVETRPRLWTRYAVVFSSERVVKRPKAGIHAGLHAGIPIGIPPAVEVRRTQSGRMEVLVVDDNEMIRTVLRRYLERKGYEVTEAMDGGVALSILQERDFDRVMVDIDMPGTTGVELFRQLDSVNPGMRERTVFMTGGFQEGKTEDFIQGTGRPHIQKPFDLKKISEILQA